MIWVWDGIFSVVPPSCPSKANYTDRFAVSMNLWRNGSRRVACSKA